MIVIVPWTWNTKSFSASMRRQLVHFVVNEAFQPVQVKRCQLPEIAFLRLESFTGGVHFACKAHQPIAQLS
jgi:hypothetical protein